MSSNAEIFVIVMTNVACNSLRMESAAPTPAELVVRVKEVMGAESDAELAHLLWEKGVRLRSIGNWKQGKGITYETTIQLLDIAGWLLLDDADERARARRTETLVARAESALDALRR